MDVSNPPHARLARSPGFVNSCGVPSTPTGQGSSRGRVAAGPSRHDLKNQYRRHAPLNKAVSSSWTGGHGAGRGASLQPDQQMDSKLDRELD